MNVRVPVRAGLAPAARLSIVLLLLVTGSVRAADIVVNTERDDLPPLSDGLCSLAEAIENSRGNRPFVDCEGGSGGVDRILIEPGLGPIELESTLVLRNGVQIIGPADRQLIRPAPGMTDNLFRFDLNSLSDNGEYLFENLILADARPSFPPPSGGPCNNGGGALCIKQDSFGPRALEVVARNSIFTENQALNDNPGFVLEGGGAIHCVGPLVTLKIEDSLFTGNVSVGDNGGGALFSSGCDVIVRRSSFEQNSAGLGGAGGAIHVRQANLLIFDSLFDPTLGAEAVRLQASNDGHLFVLDNSMILDTQGNGLRLVGPVVGSITNSTIARNSAAGLRFDGAAGNGASLSIVSSTVADNLGSAGTGGMVLIDAQTSIDNSSIIGNETQLGAAQAASGIEIEGGNLSLRNTVLSNLAAGEGNLWRRNAALVNLRHSLLSPPDTVGEINGANENNVFVSLPFGPLADLGCRRPVGFPANPAPGCVLMRPHGPFQTPIIDVASPLGNSDQRGQGFARVVGGGQDIGAYELQDPLVEFEPAAVVLAEGTGGFRTFAFTVRRLGPTDGTTQAQWEVFGHGAAPVDAADFDDSVLPSGTVFFDIGERERTVDIDVFGDGNAEADEGFRVVLQGITGGQPGLVNEAFATVLNDDALFPVPTLSIVPIGSDGAEGDLFVSPFRFLVTRTQDTEGFCSYRLSITGTGLDPIEAEDLGGEWTLGTTGPTYQMGPGEVSNEIEILIAGDSEAEGDEQFLVELVEVVGCFVNQNAASAPGIVRNDDSLFSLQSISPIQDEGDAGSTDFEFRIERSGFVDKAASVSWSVLGAGSAPADAADFAGAMLPQGQLVMGPGVVSLPVLIRVAGDTEAESDEDFAIQLESPRSGGSIDPLADFRIGTILNDDAFVDAIFADRFD
ncbi:Calx-beta domain-containing protein [Wenzhouxiangella marina]|uniref:Calx-beta domain-containing protein n=1 Tax=Wenzhouxiangella marina TaxID=1579979 RepID=A0A0K0XYV3_9GAMM|nr:Calx-beta domain-containing protein [Wenzhouxiangella marina]AKS42807.1 hypothetical protein WM2015_2445 [Wenzhouxiangella marina]MBB6087515.1 hypothetical protein [Wenzhouxiangella marina]